jgi:hypothetical protein
MPTPISAFPSSSRAALLATLLFAMAPAMAQGDARPALTALTAPLAAPSTDALATQSVDALAARLRVGDLLFIRVAFKPFLEVAKATDSWTNHVGIVVDVSGKEPLIGESKFPFSRTTKLSRFVARSQDGRIAVSRLKVPLNAEQQRQVMAAASRRAGIFYDTGFNLHSQRQFCSRYAREVLMEATGVQVGETQTFAGLLALRPGTDLGFWKAWYFGDIPWDRETVTPASLLRSPELLPVFDGVAVKSV